jgi:hypothetical protein
MSDLASDLRINPLDINADVIRQPGLFAYYCEHLHEAEKKLGMAELQTKILYAALDRQMRDMAMSKREKVTEAQIENGIMCNTHYQEKRREVIELQSQVSQLKSVVESLRQKKDMLITASTNIRADKASGFAIRDEGSSQLKADVYPLIDPTSTGLGK